MTGLRDLLTLAECSRGIYLHYEHGVAPLAFESNQEYYKSATGAASSTLFAHLLRDPLTLAECPGLICLHYEHGVAPLAFEDKPEILQTRNGCRNPVIRDRPGAASSTFEHFKLRYSPYYHHKQLL